MKREVIPGKRPVPVAWQALEDAFENNAPEVHSYLNLQSGEVIRIVDGIAEPAMHARIAGDDQYLRIDPVSSREQYRWMERFIETVDPGDFRDQLVGSIDGKGAFRRFKDVLMGHPVDRERWFTFRSERLRVAMEAWLDAHGITPVERPEWEVPSAKDVGAAAEAQDRKSPRRRRVEAAEATRQRLRELVDRLPARGLDLAVEFLTFLDERRPLPRAGAPTDARAGERAASAHDDEPSGDQGA